MIELVKKNYCFKVQMMKKMRPLAREEGSEENHEYFKFLQNEKEGSLRCLPISLTHTASRPRQTLLHSPHRTCRSWSPSVSDAAKCVIMFGIVQECLQFILPNMTTTIFSGAIIFRQSIFVIMFSCFLEMTRPSVLLPTSYQLPLQFSILNSCLP